MTTENKSIYHIEGTIEVPASILNGQWKIDIGIDGSVDITPFIAKDENGVEHKYIPEGRVIQLIQQLSSSASSQIWEVVTTDEQYQAAIQRTTASSIMTVGLTDVEIESGETLEVAANKRVYSVDAGGLRFTSGGSRTYHYPEVAGQDISIDFFCNVFSQPGNQFNTSGGNVTDTNKMRFTTIEDTSNFGNGSTNVSLEYEVQSGSIGFPVNVRQVFWSNKNQLGQKGVYSLNTKTVKNKVGSVADFTLVLDPFSTGAGGSFKVDEIDVATGVINRTIGSIEYTYADDNNRDEGTVLKEYSQNASDVKTLRRTVDEHGNVAHGDAVIPGDIANNVNLHQEFWPNGKMIATAINDGDKVTYEGSNCYVSSFGTGVGTWDAIATGYCELKKFDQSTGLRTEYNTDVSVTADDTITWVDRRSISKDGTTTENGNAVSGKYTPIASNLVNMDFVTSSELKWKRHGNIVDVFGYVQVNGNVAGVNGSYELPLPVPSNFSSIGDASGFSRSHASNSNYAVYGVVANNTVKVNTPLTDAGNWPHTINYSYEVLP